MSPHQEAEILPPESLGGDGLAIDESPERHVALGIGQGGDIDLRGGEDLVGIPAQLLDQLAEAVPGAGSDDFSHGCEACGGMSPDFSTLCREMTSLCLAEKSAQAAKALCRRK